MPFYYDGLCADHLRTWEAAKRRTKNGGGGNRNPVLFFQQKQQSTLNILNIPQMDGEESNKKGGSRRRFQNLDVLAEKFRRHRHVLFLLFVICHALFVICYLFLETFPSRLVVFFWLKQVCPRWFKVTFLSPNWRSPTTPWKGHIFTIPKRSLWLNHQVFNP